jgi:arsenate reductase
MSKIRVLFLCTGNSCRSQMAEGWARKLRGSVLEAYSAGTEKHGLDPLAVKVMSEAGVDISKQTSKVISELGKQDFEYVVTICNDVNEKCPLFPGKAKRLHHAFDNPPRIAKTLSSEEDKINLYRRVRDEIKEFISKMPNNLN